MKKQEFNYNQILRFTNSQVDNIECKLYSVSPLPHHDNLELLL